LSSSTSETKGRYPVEFEVGTFDPGAAYSADAETVDAAKAAEIDLVDWTSDVLR
jgi:hypothetical protein